MKLQNWKLHEKLEALDVETKFPKSSWRSYPVHSDCISKSKLDDCLEVQDMDTLAMRAMNNYEAIIARLEERLLDANTSLKILKNELEIKTSALSKVSFPTKLFLICGNLFTTSLLFRQGKRTI